jgi:hypothetical protein
MKIGEAHRTQSYSLYSANTIGAPMHPAPIGVADRTGKEYYWRTVPGQYCLLAEGDIGAPSQQKELRSSRALSGGRQGSVWHHWCEYLYQPPPSFQQMQGFLNPPDF